MMKNLNPDKKVIREHYDRFSESYDRERETRPHYLIRNEFEAKLITEAIEGVGGRTVLDGGVGTGRLAVRLKDKGFEVFGFDMSGEMLRKARSKGIKRVAIADLSCLPFKDKSVDVFLSILVISHVPDWESSLREMKRVARSRVIIEVINKWGLPSLINKVHRIDRKFTRRFSFRELSGTLQKAGFRSVECRGFGIFQFPRLVFSRKIIPPARWLERKASGSFLKSFGNNLILICDL